MGPGETVVNVVEAHKLNEVALSKKDFMGIIKLYLKRVETYLKENGKEDRVAPFKKGATILVKEVVSKFDEVQIYAGKEFDTEAGLMFSYTYEGEENPTFLMLVDGMKEEKF